MVILGPNGAGKTQLMRGMKQSLEQTCTGKKVSFVSAGRIGELENFRSDFDGQRGGTPNYENAHYGTKNQQKRRHKIETLNGAFQTLAARPDILIKVKERLRKLFKRDVQISWDAGTIKVFFVHDGNSEAYSSGLEASGLLHLAGLLAIIYDDEVGALLLDEPEVSLHPQLQAFLLQEILSVSGWPETGNNKKIIVLCTHSTEFVELSKPADLLNFVFVSSVSDNPIQVPADSGELKNKKIADLLGRMGQEHKLALFASSPLLVEGPSDVIIASSVARRLDIHLEVGGSQFLPVIGKGEITALCKLFRLMGKLPVVLVDADALIDNLTLTHFMLNSEQANKAATNYGAESANRLASEIHSAFCQITDKHWVSIEEKASSHPYWTKRNKTKGPDQVEAQRRAAFSTLFILTDEEINVLPEGGTWVSIKRRLETLLSLLESEGCFVLRKGTIESYFSFNAEGGNASKLAVAAAEAAALNDEDAAQVRVEYDDVVRCLEYASAAEKIVEAELLKEIFLTICAPALGRVAAKQDVSNLNAMARSSSPELASLFDLQVVDGKLRVSLTSNILDVTGFPIDIAGNENIVTVANSLIKLE